MLCPCDWVSWYEGATQRVFARAGAGTPHWNDFGAHGYPAEYFADVQHLNTVGAEAYTADLDKRLNAVLDGLK